MNQKYPLKRWTFVDTINLCLFIYVVLFVIDFKNHSGLSFIIIAAFIVWVITVISKNIIISKKQKEQQYLKNK
ncbi:hypothetical protein [Macrococcoides canis]|uniref:Uncharacterized protein n=1 Tax=Macrococcoides canis TaxID=1855823 RepID=A0A1W7AA14_9STAP|nr:hypothetical protein [Macrococcus canis]ARQ06344.1 hypothetical protein MCCS_06940 [Macrococcus canis]MCO4096518.1 hypothetical protein [Macrococcus canis]MEE1107507.1 hypothetical protein [Macrococcus canis]QCT74305.1 hypothetical protein EST43_03235 [Macrococcus canis]QIH75369.1 hypothetical protein GTN31_03305 [Macrococcus canis]